MGRQSAKAKALRRNLHREEWSMAKSAELGNTPSKVCKAKHCAKQLACCCERPENMIVSTWLPCAHRAQAVGLERRWLSMRACFNSEWVTQDDPIVAFVITTVAGR